jgi:PAS domain-containing protein
VLASLVPACWVAAALTRLMFDPDWQGANVLVMGVVALAGGIGITLGLARDLGRAVGDLTAGTEAMVRGVPATRLFAAVQELQTASGVLETAAQRFRETGELPPLRRDMASAERPAPTVTDCTWEWDLAAGDLRWSDAASRVLGLPAGATPSRARLLEIAHPADRGALAAWLASVARGLATASVEFRIATGDGAPRAIRCAGTAERNISGRIVAVAGRFEAAAGATATLAA